MKNQYNGLRKVKIRDSWYWFFVIIRAKGLKGQKGSSAQRAKMEREVAVMVDVAISVQGKFYSDAISKALKETGNFRVKTLEECPEPEVALLGISVHQGYTLRERQEVIERLRKNRPDCKIVLFIDELVSKEQTEGVKSLKQARLIDGFLYASGTMEYLIATLESI